MATEGLPEGFAEGIRRQEVERKTRQRQGMMDAENARRLIEEHFDLVHLGTGSSPLGLSGPPIVLYECRRCRALVRPSKEAQVEHLARTHDVHWEDPGICTETTTHIRVLDPDGAEPVEVTCLVYAGHPGMHRGLRDGEWVFW